MTSSPWKYGFADAVMNRPSQCPFKAYPAQEAYLRGYMKGKSQLEFKQPQERKQDESLT